MAERDIPEDWSSARRTQSDEVTRLFNTEQLASHKSGVPTTGSSANSVSSKNKSNSKKLAFKSHSKESIPANSDSRKLPKWLTSWVLWAFLLAFIPGTIGFMAMAILLKLPSAPNCPSIFWPLASASVRMHCAEVAASKETVKDLLQAIDLVKNLPENHPLRAEIDRSMEEWSRRVLDLASESFQEGKLEEAIEIARKLPTDVSVSKLVDDQINSWRLTWSKAEDIYKEAEEEMREQRWNQAFMVSAKLLRLDNRFWSSVKYDELNNLIVTAREDGEKLAQAESLAKSNNVDQILKAIKLAQSIAKNSYIYQKAQEAIPEFGLNILELAERKLEQRDADEAIYIAQKIPPISGIEAETTDFISLAEAQRNAWTGTISGLEAAIVSAQQIDSNRPIYQKAQKLIASWQLEIEDVSRLEKARTLASQGTIGDLSAAIAEARLIPQNNPRAQEARKEINDWSTQVQTIEDRPFLERAEELALFGDTSSLRAAIAEASRIGRGRALYREAQKKIVSWNSKVQQTEDQPYLDQARSLANSGDLNAAINTARQIRSGRVLSRQAQRDINEWQAEVTARDSWTRAREVALRGTPNALSQAIALARRVPRGTALRSDARIAMDQWSQQLLDIARTQGQSDIIRAIETAKLVPQGTQAYNAAQDQIRTWRDFLNPPQPEPQLIEPTIPEPEPGTGNTL
ncbi:chromosome segregation ATPase [Plectonema cf. radiosum LEGE 06105]|uniref:Chromosome segregation ATPase n=1 Tax=Plectonema cf. radiosum LEGE 06105 TaxID=945769 RepID=A0A8J7F4C5_9CYAN|nr:chromosome segregation ATPase [Plectonema radiosum]MBE9213230.1 chromosome segregation ATPase [Plectonema cf. radiosum LEGE 06105]